MITVKTAVVVIYIPNKHVVCYSREQLVSHTEG
jgi:hypothetical protein